MEITGLGSEVLHIYLKEGLQGSLLLCAATQERLTVQLCLNYTEYTTQRISKLNDRVTRSDAS